MCKTERLNINVTTKRYQVCSNICWKLFFYASALNKTMLKALNDIRSQQALPTKKVKQKVQQFPDYVNTYQSVFLRFYASDIQLHIDTDAVLLVLP